MNLAINQDAGMILSVGEFTTVHIGLAKYQDKREQMNTCIMKTEIQLQDEVINGELKVIDGVWRFNSDHPGFKALFPTGSVCSFSTEKELAETRRQEVFHVVQRHVFNMLH